MIVRTLYIPSICFSLPDDAAACVTSFPPRKEPPTQTFGTVCCPVNVNSSSCTACPFGNVSSSCTTTSIPFIPEKSCFVFLQYEQYVLEKTTTFLEERNAIMSNICCRKQWTKGQVRRISHKQPTWWLEVSEMINSLTLGMFVLTADPVFPITMLNCKMLEMNEQTWPEHWSCEKRMVLWHPDNHWMGQSCWSDTKLKYPGSQTFLSGSPQIVEYPWPTRTIRGIVLPALQIQYVHDDKLSIW